MTKTITDIINALPLGTVVVIHFTIGSIEWRTSVSMEGFLGQTLGSRVVKRISRTVLWLDNSSTLKAYSLPASLKE